MHFLAMATLKNVRACLRLPISMMPRFSLKLMLARLRTGMVSVGSLLRSAAVITVSATPTSFFSTTALFVPFAMRPLLLLFSLGGLGSLGGLCLRLGACALRRRGRPDGDLGLRLRRFGRRDVRPLGAGHDGRLPLRALGRDDDRVRQALGTAVAAEDLVRHGAARSLGGDLLQLRLELFLRQLAALEPRARLHDLLDVELEDVA